MGGGGFKKSQLLPSYNTDAPHLVYERLCFIFDKEWLEFLLGVNLSVIGNPMHYCRWLWCETANLWCSKILHYNSSADEKECCMGMYGNYFPIYVHVFAKEKYFLMARKDCGVKCHFPSMIVLRFMQYIFTFMGRRKKALNMCSRLRRLGEVYFQTWYFWP